MSGPKRNPDKLNTIGVVVVGICGAVLVYVTIVALQAFYMNDTSEIQTMADYGGQDATAKGRKADEMRNITEAASNPPAPGMQPTYRIPIKNAIELVIEDAKKDPAHLVPALPRAEKASVEPVFGRPKPLGGPAPAPAGDAPADGAAPPEAATPGAGGTAAPQVPTGAPGQPQPVPGAGGVSPTGAPAQPQPAQPAQPRTP